jgi:hypothetical protein
LSIYFIISAISFVKQVRNGSTTPLRTVSSVTKLHSCRALKVTRDKQYRTANSKRPCVYYNTANELYTARHSTAVGVSCSFKWTACYDLSNPDATNLIKSISIVGIVTRLWARRPRKLDSIPSMSKESFLLQNVKVRSGVHTASYSRGHQDLLHRVIG